MEPAERASVSLDTGIGNLVSRPTIKRGKIVCSAFRKISRWTHRKRGLYYYS
jgi:hypothetical protein